MKLNGGLLSLSSFALGAGLMYLFDPERGRRRRAMVRDKLIWATHKLNDAVDATSEDLEHRAQGTAAEAVGWVREVVLRRPVDDDVLVERVRARLGRVAWHPGAIEVMAHNGRVTLRGQVLAREVDAILAAARSVRGVRAVINELEVHERPGDIPSLQGGRPRPEPRPDFLQTNWAPATRVLATLGGSLLGISGLRQGGLAGAVMFFTGAALAARGATNMELKRLLGLGAGRRAVDFHKEITVRAPVERVFEFWRHFENFPRFMAHVKEVRDLGNGRSHWTVVGPAGTSVQWDAEITKLEPNRVLAWKTVPGAVVQHAGIIRFEPNPDGSTRLNIRLSYNPPAGAIGHLIAALLGSDPKHAMDEDLVRFKSLIEEGKASAPGKRATREDVAGAPETPAPTERRVA